MDKRKLTDIQKECYERNCICSGCDYLRYNARCKVKWSIINKIKFEGLDENLKTKGAIYGI